MSFLLPFRSRTSDAAPDSARRPGAGRVGARRAGALAAVAATVALATTACLGPAEAPAPKDGHGSSGTSGSGKVPAGLKSYYDQKVDWKRCGNLECATITAPMDYSDPGSAPVDLAINRLPATGKKQGSLLVNPGGPGGSGTDFVKNSISFVASDKLRSHYDMIGFDPRGVGASTSVLCLSDRENDKVRETTKIPRTGADVKALIKASEVYSKTCEQRTPNGLLDHVDTESAARDMDIMRAVLGEDHLDYLGMSYGTKLGATYLRLFPSNAGRLVLDGALDPSLSETQVATGQAKAFERALDLYLDKCMEGQNCPFTGSVSHARSQLTDFLTQADKKPLETSSGRVLPASDIVSALLLALYEPTTAPSVTAALESGMENDDGSQLMVLADLSADRSNDGKYSNTNDAFTAINCKDYAHLTGSVSAIEEREKKMTAQAPFFGPYMGFDDGCSTWPAKATPQAADYSVKHPATAPLIVGTTGDPATPYAWAGSMQKLIPGSRVLTYKGEGHTAYGRSNQCVTNTVDDYLLTGKLPDSDPTC